MVTEGGPVVSVEELRRLMERARPPVLLDVRWRLAGPPGRDEFLRGHLPGAVFVDLERDLAGPPGPGGRHPLPEPGVLQAALRRAGVGGGSSVVVYDQDDASAAARAWWLLRWAGHRDVTVLDGGLAAWLAAGHALESGAGPLPPEGDLVVVPGGMPAVDADGAAALARTGVLLDVRAAERYRGETEPVDRVAGHLPGAVSAPGGDLVGGDGRFWPRPDLVRRFARLGADGSRPVGAMCGSGVTAAQTVLALELVGVRAALYAGSWSEWISDPRRPVAVGALPG